MKNSNLVNKKGEKIRNNRYIYLIIFMFLLMVLDAVAENLKGVFLPIFKNDFRINDSIMGVWLFVGSLGYIVFTYLGGLFSKKIGHKKVIGLGIILCAISTFLFSISHTSRIMIFIDTFLINGALALCAIAINTLIPMVGVGFQAVLMNLTHFFYGFGATIGTGATGYLLGNNITWQKIYFGVSILYIVIGIISCFIKVPEISLVEDSKEEESNKSLFKNKLVYAFSLALGFYVFAECATINWLVNYCDKSFGLTIVQATKYLSIFTAVLTIGRLVGGFIVEKIGELKSVILSTATAIILFAIGVSIKEQGIILISLSGLFFSIVYPTIVLSSSRVFKKESSYAMGVIISMATGVNMIFNVVLGSINQIMGPTKGFLIIPISLCISIGAQIYIKKSCKKVR